MIEAEIKTKRKIKPGLKNWLASLFEPVMIDFTAYLPLEECAIRLESREKHSWWRSTKTTVTITLVDDATYDFTIKREYRNHSPVEAHGYLQEYEGSVTYAVGEVITRTNWFINLIRAFVGIAWVVLIFHPVDVLLFFAVIWTIGIIVDVFTQMHYRHELAEMIETTLGY